MRAPTTRRCRRRGVCVTVTCATVTSLLPLLYSVGIPHARPPPVTLPGRWKAVHLAPQSRNHTVLLRQNYSLASALASGALADLRIFTAYRGSLGMWNAFPHIRQLLRSAGYSLVLTNNWAEGATLIVVRRLVRTRAGCRSRSRARVRLRSPTTGGRVHPIGASGASRPTSASTGFGGCPLSRARRR